MGCVKCRLSTRCDQDVIGRRRHAGPLFYACGHSGTQVRRARNTRISRVAGFGGLMHGIQYGPRRADVVLTNGQFDYILACGLHLARTIEDFPTVGAGGGEVGNAMGQFHGAT